MKILVELRKLFFGMILIPFLLISCGPKQKSDESRATSGEQILTEESHTGGLALNNGSKWDSDESTNENAGQLIAIVNQAAPAGIHEYHIVAGDLQKSLDKMMRECRMKGADHDALHLWLEPLLTYVDELEQGSVEAELPALYKRVKDQINLYPEYFE